jgi:phosphoribosylformylglycinamidine synthase
MLEKDVPFSTLGHVTKSELRIDDDSFGFIHDVKKLYEEALAKMVEE